MASGGQCSDSKNSIRDNLPTWREARLQRRAYLIVGPAVEIHEPDRILRRTRIQQEQVLCPITIEIADGLDLGIGGEHRKDLAGQMPFQEGRQLGYSQLACGKVHPDDACIRGSQGLKNSCSRDPPTYIKVTGCSAVSVRVIRG